MAVLSQEEYINRIRERIGEGTSDEDLAFVQDMTDTFNDLTARAGDTDNWKQRYEENDKDWRKRYRDAFFSATPEPPKVEEEKPEENKPLTFDSLFTKG